MTQNFLNSIEDLISKGEIETAIEKMILFFRTISQESNEDTKKLNSIYSSLIICSAQYHKYKEDILSNIIRDQDYVQFSRIAKNILDILSKIKKIELEGNYRLNNTTSIENQDRQNKNLVELKINSNIESFTLGEQEKIISKISNLLNLDKTLISVKYLKSGSVLMGIKIPQNSISLLLKYFQEGRLSSFNIIGVKEISQLDNIRIIRLINLRIFEEKETQKKKLNFYWGITLIMTLCFPILICFTSFYMYSSDILSFDVPLYMNYPFIFTSLLFTFNIIVDYYLLKKYRKANLRFSELDKISALTDLLNNPMVDFQNELNKEFFKNYNRNIGSSIFDFSSSNLRRFESELVSIIKKLFKK